LEFRRVLFRSAPLPHVGSSVVVPPVPPVSSPPEPSPSTSIVFWPPVEDDGAEPLPDGAPPMPWSWNVGAPLQASAKVTLEIERRNLEVVRRRGTMTFTDDSLATTQA